jgi:hypothetical protein
MKTQKTQKTHETLLEELNQEMTDSFEQAMCQFLDFKKEGIAFKEFNDLQNSDFNSNFVKIELHENLIRETESHGTSA